MKYSINLASRSYVNKRALFLAYALCGVALAVGLLFNAGYLLKLNNQIDTTEVRLAELEEKLISSQGGGDVASYTAARYEKVLKEIKAANGILKRDAFRWTTLLGQLEKVVPGKVSIEKITPDHKNRSIKISGLAKELRDMQRFLDNLIKSGDYTNVLLLNQVSVKTEDANSLLSFSLELQGAF